MISLQIRMALVLAVLFGIVYAIAVAIGYSMGITDFWFYLVLSLVFMAVQYAVGPMLVEWTMRVRYVERKDHPRLFEMVEALAMRAGIPAPRIGISPTRLPNAFAFGRGVRDGRVCVTQGILDLLSDDELKAVLAHEMTHLKNRDVLTITLLSVIPMLLYRLAFSMFFSGHRRDSERSSNAQLIGIAAFALYFITNLLVLYASRIREYFADKGAVELGGRPASLASALYKLVYGAARIDREDLRQVEGMKAFFASDPSQAQHEIRDLVSLDRDRNGSIDPAELQALRAKSLKLSFNDKMMEMLGTHPNMLKRIKKLSEYGFTTVSGPR